MYFNEARGYGWNLNMFGLYWIYICTDIKKKKCAVTVHDVSINLSKTLDVIISQREQDNNLLLNKKKIENYDAGT